MDRRCGKVIEYLFASAKLSVQPPVPQIITITGKLF
jgi:hypothetical protein